MTIEKIHDKKPENIVFSGLFIHYSATSSNITFSDITALV